MDDRDGISPAGTHVLASPLTRCPACGSDALAPVTERDGETVNFLCGSCDRCWHVELGHVHRVDPASCSGCPERARCEAADAADHRGAG